MPRVDGTQQHHPTPVLGLERPAHRRQRHKAAAVTAADCMSAPAVTIDPGATARFAARLLHRRGIHHLPVVDGDGRLLGIVSRRDLLTVFLRPDAEITEEIRGDLRAVATPAPMLGRGELRVQVHDGMVVLEGETIRRSEAIEAARSAALIDGVIGVTSRLLWEVDDTQPIATTPWG